MNTDADTTILHLGLMEWLAESLAGNYLAIYRHTYDQLAFGSWEVVIGTALQKAADYLGRKVRNALSVRIGVCEFWRAAELEKYSDGSVQWRLTRQSI